MAVMGYINFGLPCEASTPNLFATLFQPNMRVCPVFLSIVLIFRFL